MKNIIISTFTVLLTIIIVSCNHSSNKKNGQYGSDSVFFSTLQASSLSKEDSTAIDTVFKDSLGLKDASKTIKTSVGFSINPILIGYLSLKNNLVKDDGRAAADAAEQLLKVFTKVNIHVLSTEDNKKYIDIADGAKENVEHIGTNGGNIEHQREHFALLSEDLKDLINLFGTSKTIYQDRCPMFNDANGAIWFSETKEIKNPYYGSRMISCGKMQQIIASK
ncbi:MAG: hypothetical protein DI598_09825 [Pseudopedobacter saltans]|uniref:DUF3347 domain-containing protein n=1 Tax=Pseudopedobacter saltans TaxID=151895 RepID=A0A2W5F4U3_9SPHI|nr:MAG: hypothetical protein DI598_09825 [Pseudopedobacter saltans]